MILGNDQGVHRCLRIDIVKCKNEVVFVDDFAGDLAFDDLAEDTIISWIYSRNRSMWAPRALSFSSILS